MSNFPDILKKLRTSKGLSQKQLGSMLNVTQNAIFNWESGRTQPTLEMLERLSAIFEVEPSFLLGYPQTENSYIIQKTERELLEKYKSLDDAGRKTVNVILDYELDRVQLIKEKDATISNLMNEYNKLLSGTKKRAALYEQQLLAAHVRTDIETTPEDIQHDLDIMDDDSWEE